MLMMTLMELEVSIISEVRQRKTNTMWYHLYVESKKQHKTNRKQTYRYREWVRVANKEEGGNEISEWG